MHCLFPECEELFLTRNLILDARKVVEVLSKWILREESLALTKNALTEPTKYSLDEENRRRFPASPAYDILLTLVNPDPEKLKVNWSLPTIADGEILILINFPLVEEIYYFEFLTMYLLLFFNFGSPKIILSRVIYIFF